MPEIIINIFRDIFENPALVVTPATSPADIKDWDSVAQVKLTFAIEEQFGIEFTTEEVASFYCAGDFVKALEARQILA